MLIIQQMDISQLKQILNSDLNIGIPASKDMGDRMALIIMICYLTNVLKQKKPGITHYQVIRLCTKGLEGEDTIIDALSLICDWFASGCTKFPDLGYEAKKMPDEIKRLIHQLMPF